MEMIVFLVSLAFVAWVAVRLGKSAKHPEPARIDTPPPRAPSPPSTKPVPVAVRPKARPDDCWIPPGREIQMAGFQLRGGMLYVGSGLPSVSSYGTEPALIDPALPVNAGNPDPTGSGMTYWPSYESISPECRAGYLQWLASNRRVPGAYIGYVFLFLYGLERRVLADTPGSGSAQTDLVAIGAELEGLLEVYGSNSSFNRYALQLKDVLEVLSGRDLAPPVTADTDASAMPMPVRVGLGRIVALGKPVPPEWAVRWYMTHPDTSLRTPARRCTNEFVDLFQARYVREFGDGFTVTPLHTRLALDIRPASASFGGQVSLPVAVPDILQLHSSIAKLRTIGDSCIDDLDAFSRWIGRHVGAPRTIAAAALLPRDIAASHGSAEVQGVWDWAARCVKSHTQAVCRSDELLQLCPSLGSGKLAKSEAVLLAQLLERGGFGIEPDVRFGGPPLAPGAPVVLYPLPQSAPNPAPSPQYTATTILLHLAIAVAAADHTISEVEERHLRARVTQALALTEHERLRLSAHLQWLVEAKPSVTSLRRRLEALESAQRSGFADFIVGVAGADGLIDPEEIQTLGKIFPLLGLPAEEVHSHVHAMAAAGSTSAPKRKALEPLTDSSASPHPATRPSPEPVRLDLDLVRAKLAESAQIGAILEDVLVSDDEIAVSQEAPTVRAVESRLQGRRRLLARLVGQSEWTRLDFEHLAAECQLLPDGAIDAINEASIDKLGVPVIEGDDPLHIDLPTAMELIQ